MITTPVAFIALFLLVRQSLGRLWHSANGMRGGRTGRFGLTCRCRISPAHPSRVGAGRVFCGDMQNSILARALPG
jgi:hypothetical protein